MATLITGPSSAGKSTLLGSPWFAGHYPALVAPGTKLKFGTQLEKGTVNKGDLVHYNLLHFLTQPTAKRKGTVAQLLVGEEIFSKILKSGKLERALVLVAPQSELVRRAKERKHVEKGIGDGGKYHSTAWAEALAKLDLHALYDALFECLASANIPFDVIYSSAELDGGFAVSDRVYIHHNLAGNMVLPPPKDVIAKVRKMPGSLYQTVDLPRGMATESRGFGHLGGARESTFRLLFNGSLVGRSILDIGCASGDFLYRAERLGASTLVGVELSPERSEAAEAIGRLLYSRAVIHRMAFTDFSSHSKFDDVLILNVIHHVKDFDSFLEKAAGLAQQRLIIEFPTLLDPVLVRLNKFEFPPEINDFALIGVSGKSADQTYVFSPKALHRIVMENIGGFKHCEAIESPIAGRQILIFSR